jgi:hypothetical protein
MHVFTTGNQTIKINNSLLLAIYCLLFKLEQSHRVDAIKLVRTVNPGCGLREAKNVVDYIQVNVVRKPIYPNDNLNFATYIEKPSNLVTYSQTLD